MGRSAVTRLADAGARSFKPSPVCAPKEVSMRRALALMALSLFLSLSVTAVMFLIGRPDARAALRNLAIRCGAEGEEEVE
jgi:hypothetical protein